jgi:hypothetical protein
MEFCYRVGMDYVSCSPYRVPIARLATRPRPCARRRRSPQRHIDTKLKLQGWGRDLSPFFLVWEVKVPLTSATGAEREGVGEAGDRALPGARHWFLEDVSP